MTSPDVNMLDLPLNVGDLDLHDSASEEERDDSDSTDDSSVDELHRPPIGLPSRDLPTGLCYDERMRYHAEIAALSAEAVHPEDPRRIYYIFKELCEAGLVAAKGYEVMVNQPLLRIDAREATEEEITLVHTQEHFDFVRNTSHLSNEALIDLSEAPHMDSIYFNKLSYFSGKLSAGGAIETCKAVIERRVKNAIAVIRPPGHHAEVNSTMGFCLFNNTCIASKVCQNTYGAGIQNGCRKILILDWDVHHGNGCQKAFYRDPNILYISLHVHQGGRFYPSGPAGGMDQCGEGPGEGYNVNIPWESKGMGDGDYMYAFQHVVMPIANSFDPDLVIVAAGFDAAAGDELGGCNVTPACYAHMTFMLMSLARGKVAVCLEGGYNFRAISRSALAVTKTLMGEPPDPIEPTSATESAITVLEQVKKTQSRYWKCMVPKAPLGNIYGGERLHDVLRQHQAAQLFEKYRLTSLKIHRERISPSFDDQVLGSAYYDTKKHLIVFFHDPPDLLSDYDQTKAQQKPHNTWMLDATEAYIATAVNADIGVIDINIPELITITADPAVDEGRLHTNKDVEYDSNSTNVARLESEKLATYIWENYIEPFEFPGGIWLIGAGHAFHAVAKLICDNENVHTRVKGVFGFLCDEPPRPISNIAGNNYNVMSWYRDCSKVYVAKSHGIWEKAAAKGKKISKSYGRLIKSDETMLSSMLQKHLPEVFDFIRETGDFPTDADIDEAISPEVADTDSPKPSPEYSSAYQPRSTLSSPPQAHYQAQERSNVATASAALRGAVSTQETISAEPSAWQEADSRGSAGNDG